MKLTRIHHDNNFNKIKLRQLKIQIAARGKMWREYGAMDDIKIYREALNLFAL